MKITYRALVSHYGHHRRTRRPHGALVDTAFRHCPVCGVETAAIVHRDGTHTCTEGHHAGGGA